MNYFIEKFYKLHGYYRDLMFKKCNIVNSTLIQCLIPQIKDKRLTPTNLQASNNIVYDSLNYYFYIQFNEISNKYANQQMAEFKHLRVYQDPVFDDAQIFSDKTPIILINVNLE